MTTVSRTIEIEASAEHCWDALKDFGAIHQRLAAGFVVEANLISDDVRMITFASGVVLKERLVGIDDDAMRFAYAVIEDPVGITHHNGSVQIFHSAEPGHCNMVWITDVLPDELGELVGALMDEGLTAIKQTLEAGA